MISWHRFYDPNTGRYISADPVGLRGGINLFAYVQNDPIINIDPMGLIKWTGTSSTFSLTGPIGATFGKFVLTSECIDNKKATVTIVVAGVTGAIGLELGYTESDVSMHDFSEIIQPSNFQPSNIGGWYFDTHSGIAIGAGGTISNTSLGNVFPDEYITVGSSKGGEVTLASLTLGSSTLWDVKWDCCQ